MNGNERIEQNPKEMNSEDIRHIAMNEHVDFIMSTDKNYLLEAVSESDDAIYKIRHRMTYQNA